MMWGLVNCVCHQDNLMLSSRWDDNLNSDLGHGAWSVSEKSASIFSRTFRDRAVGACCTEQGAATDRFGGPPINRVSLTEVTSFPSSSSSRSHHFLPLFAPQRSCDLLAPVPNFVLWLSPCYCHRFALYASGICALSPCATLDPSHTLTLRWRWIQFASRTPRRRGSSRP
jgi:hypothetical protein